MLYFPSIQCNLRIKYYLIKYQNKYTMAKVDQLPNREQMIIERFLDALWMENGLSKNTLTAYKNDLANLASWLILNQSALPQATQEKIQAFLAHRFEIGSKNRSSARLISSMRRFYAWLLRERIISTDPVALIEAPKPEQPLPKTLTEQQVVDLINAPDPKDTLGIRDKAMLETLYATGLRVSELVGLEFSQVSLDPGVVRIIGKGGKERLVPLGEEAIDCIIMYTKQARVELMENKPPCNALFVSRRGQAMTRQTFWGRRFASTALSASISALIAASAAYSVVTGEMASTNNIRLNFNKNFIGDFSIYMFCLNRPAGL